MLPETPVPPTEEPVSIEEARAWLRLGTDGETAVLQHAIAAARQEVETRTGRALVTRTVRERFGPARLCGKGLSGGHVLLTPALLPVAQVLTAATVAEDGSLVPCPAGRVTLDGSRLRLAAPATGLVVDYVAGIGAASSIPMGWKVSVLEALAAILARRESGSAGPVRMPDTNGARL
jgi:uncharacterized phiE125 gp8 family phage protein